MGNSQKNTITIGSLCSGYGGIELGLRRIFGSQMRTVFYVERETFAVANLVAKIEEGKLDAAPIWTDIKTFDGRNFRDRIHLITGGYPCQGESVAGKRKGKADPRWLWPHIERIIEAVRPVWCFFENVPGHLTLGFPTVYRSLRNLGYKVEAGLFSAAGCGKSHIRERLFILAYTNSKRLETHRYSEGCKAILKEQTPTTYNCTDAIRRFWNTSSATVGRNDGLRNKLDRFRLLGNGVIPQQAAAAFMNLIEKI